MTTAIKAKVAIITGASRGIGKEVAYTLAQAGASVMLIARSEHGLQAIAGEIVQNGGRASYFVGDISNEQDVNALYRKTIEAFGSIDIVVNNAGVGVFKPVEEISAADWDSMMNINVRGTFLLTKAVVPYMKKRRKGWIVNIASDVSKRTFPTGSAYCASKYAQHAFAESVRKEVKAFGVRVSTVYPGMVDTTFGESEQGADYKQEWLKPSDIAQAVVYVLSAPGYVVIDEVVLHPAMQDW